MWFNFLWQHDDYCKLQINNSIIFIKILTFFSIFIIRVRPYIAYKSILIFNMFTLNKILMIAFFFKQNSKCWDFTILNTKQKLYYLIKNITYTDSIYIQYLI